MIKWIISDMDNTLLTEDKQLSQMTIEVIATMQTKGLSMGLATGRAYELAKPYGLQLKTDLPMILNNGALTKTLEGQSMHQSYLDFSAIEPLRQFADSENYPVTFYTEDGFFTDDAERLDFYHQWNRTHPESPIAVWPLAALSNQTNIYKMLMVIDETTAMEAAINRFNDHPLCHITRSQHNFFDVLPLHTNKAAALKRLLAHHGVHPDEIVVFGDEDNDAEMLALTPHSFAMPNGSKKAKNAAQYLAEDTNADDGVAKTLTKLLKTTLFGE